MAPDISEYVSEREVRNHWMCSTCGYEVETSFTLSPQASLSPEIVEQFFPTLVIA